MHSDGLKHVPKVPHAIEKAVHHEWCYTWHSSQLRFQWKWLVVIWLYLPCICSPAFCCCGITYIFFVLLKCFYQSLKLKFSVVKMVYFPNLAEMRSSTEQVCLFVHRHFHYNNTAV
jgi:hypothetical protein